MPCQNLKTNSGKEYLQPMRYDFANYAWHKFEKRTFEAFEEQEGEKKQKKEWENYYIWAGNLSTHLEIQSGENQHKSNQLEVHAIWQASSGNLLNNAQWRKVQ